MTPWDLAGGQSTRHVHWKIQYDRQVDKNPIVRVIDDPSLERPRYVECVRRLSQSTLQHVRPCSVLVPPLLRKSSLEYRYRLYSLMIIHIQSTLSFCAFFLIHYRLEFFGLKKTFLRQNEIRRRLLPKFKYLPILWLCVTFFLCDR